MKNNLLAIIFVSIITLSLIGVGCTNNSEIKKEEVISQSSDTIVEDKEENVDVSFGSKGAKSDNNLTNEEMMKYAIEDEYLARREYEIIMGKYGDQKPFSNIIKAEETHIALLKELFKQYNITVPEDISKEYAVLPNTLAESYKAGENAEIENIAMYERFLKENIPDDIKQVFTELRDASRNHLNAFQNKLN